MMPPLRRRAIAFLTWACVAGLAHADIVSIQWTPSGTFERTLSVAPSKFTEVCGALTPGQSVRWRFRADQPLDFNVHYHAGKDVVYPVRRDGAKQMDGTLAVTRSEEYCWMWTNGGTRAARIVLNLSR